MIKKFYFSFFVLFLVLSSSAQVACDLLQTPTVDTSIPCAQTCVALKLKVANISSTTNYTVTSGQYLPYPYLCPSDTALTSLYIDDKFSPVINMPFTFCFYGQSYNKVVIGSNGLVTFDIVNANCGNAYTLQANQPIPLANGTQCGNIGTPYYPRASIMGAYYDIDPSGTFSGLIGRRISYYFTGTAPNRKMVVVFYHIPLYSCTASLGVDAPDNPNNPTVADQQIVIYESTGIIDVNIGNKPSCSWNGGLAILGIQNWDRTQGVAAPGKNCTQWTAVKENYRFTPSGAGPSLFKKIELYQGNTLIDTGTVVIDSTGQMIANFPNVCFNTDTAVYRAVTYYSGCGAAANAPLVSFETKVIVRHNTVLNVTAGFTPASCATGGSGTITISNPVGAEYSYSIDTGHTYQSSPVFSAPNGTYVVIVKNVQRGCIGSTSVVVPIIESVKFNTTTTSALCYGTATGKAIITTQGGAAPFQFSADSGITYQSSNTLFLTAGRHVIRVKDNNGCTKDTVINISQPDSISMAQTVNAAYCSGTPDGQIIIAASGGTPGYKYSLTNTTAGYQNSDTLFANVGSFTAYVKDANGCVDSIANITVALNDTMRLAAIADTSVCLGSSITIYPSTNATQFTWGPASGISNPAAASPTFLPQDTTDYYVLAKLGTLCSRTDTFTINVWKHPIVDAGSDTTICFGTQAYFHATALRANKYRWSPSANLSNYAIANPRATGYAPLNYVVEVTDEYGCGFKAYDTIRLTVRPKVRAYAGQDTTATLGRPVQLFGCCMDLYRWEPTAIFPNDTARNPFGNFPPGTTQVVMTTTTPEGCEGKDTVIVKGYIGPTYYVPSGFSPNGDGRNDIFRPTPVGITETYYFNVYNRFGQLIYTTKTFMDGWDGKWKGQIQPQAAYVWMVKGMGYDGKIVEMKGTVILMQ